ncbi:dihydroorotase [Avrilella dinanensis]|uniref:Dihydroorotase n=1 Tax=Avrilella dinanensis TaxID=2008672 RepID=A0A2M9R6B6_9FLAO|nr:dihydroorotase [Avrilella dinanensis]PJR04407.1 dihydroorotase [Avrilella dinanensis]
MNIIIKNACIIDPFGAYNQQIKSIKISNGIINKIADDIAVSDNDLLVDIPNLHISYGWIDSSVSFGEPGYEERETIAHGLEVAAKSGFTHICLNPNTDPVIDNQAGINLVLSKASGQASTLLPIGALTKNSEGIDMAEMFDMKNAGAVAFGDYKKSMENANLLKISLQYTQNFNARVIAYASDKNIKGKGVVNEGVVSTRLGLKGIPDLAEEIVVARNLYLLEYTSGKMHIPTISTQKSIELIKAAKAKGLDVTCSVAVHHLVLTDEQLDNFDTRYKVAPPLKDETTRQALINAVLDDTIDCITTDHQPWDIEHKKLEFDLAKDGTIGLESAFGALQNVLPLDVIIKKLLGAYTIFTNIIPEITVDRTANLTLFSPDTAYTFTVDNILSKSKNSAFLRQQMKGKVSGIINNNKLIINE